MQNITYKISRKENFYFGLKLFFSAILYILIGLSIYSFFTSTSSGPNPQVVILFIYAIMILLYIFFSSGILVGHIKGNGVRVTKNQFPEIYEIVEMVDHIFFTALSVLI